MFAASGAPGWGWAAGRLRKAFNSQRGFERLFPIYKSDLNRLCVLNILKASRKIQENFSFILQMVSAWKPFFFLDKRFAYQLKLVVPLAACFA